jgi:hypothetical protein
MGLRGSAALPITQTNHSTSNTEHRMKNKLNSKALGAMLLLSALTSSLSPALAQITPTTLGTVTNLPATVAAESQADTTSYINLQNNSGLALSWKFNVSAGTSNAVLLLYPSVDKTNYDSVPWQLIRPATDTANQVATTNWSSDQLRGYTSLKIGALTNENAGTLTNKGVVFSRPNN